MENEPRQQFNRNLHLAWFSTYGIRHIVFDVGDIFSKYERTAEAGRRYPSLLANKFLGESFQFMAAIQTTKRPKRINVVIDEVGLDNWGFADKLSFE